MTFGKRLISIAMALVLILSVTLTAAGCTKKEQQLKEEIGETIETGGNDDKGQGVEPSPAVPVLAPGAGYGRIDVPYEETKYTAKVPGYSINADLSNIENLEQFGSFTEGQKALLAKNGFVVTPKKEEQLFYIYENNEYLLAPSFVTVDSVLQVYHVFYDYSLRRLENETLVSELKKLTDSMLRKSVELYGKIQNERLKELELKNIAYFGVAALALGIELPSDLPAKAKELAKQEFDLVKADSGYKPSLIFPYELDYSQYKPRGHYTKNDDLKSFFRAMMWYGQVPFPAYRSGNERNEEQTLQAMLITYILLKDNTNDLESWQKIYEPTSFYVGQSDDLNLLDYGKLLTRVYGESPDINRLDDKDKMDQLYEAIKELPEPAIVPKYASVSTPAGKQFRLMGQRYIADSEILQELVEPYKRPAPKGLDLMAVLGSKRSHDLLYDFYKEDKTWDGYTKAFDKMKTKFDGLEKEKWQSNMYFGWLWSLKGLLKEFGEGYPSFMRNEAWQDKSINTALGSWSELRHDTVLYGKGIAAECGGGEMPPQVRGYVEPNIEVYDKLLWLTRYSRENLKAKGILQGELESRMTSFEELLQFLIRCSVKELANEELSKDEYYQLLVYGGWLESLTGSMMEDAYKWYQITSETDRNMAVIADIATVVNGGVLEVGVGPAYEIFTIVPIGGKLYITRGAVFSYYEFMSETRLTDEEWQQLHKYGKAPAQQEWMKSFIDNEVKTEAPVPAEPYNSGC
ncbi:MAG TPA: DUF3160 domain-containing protein [Negativicutes bacterium]|nr:DUF3160 domain-containing protein [Negativicutes bacterium]